MGFYTPLITALENLVNIHCEVMCKGHSECIVTAYYEVKVATVIIKIIIILQSRAPRFPGSTFYLHPD